MKSNTILLTALILLTAISIAAAKNKLTPEAKIKAEINYLEGLKSENEGLRVSSAYFLGEINSSKAVIPLMNLLRNDKSEPVRIVAALSLIKLEDARGVHLVKRSIEFNDFEKVRERCERFYAGYLTEQKSKTAENDAVRVADLLKP
jgi:HEAT repeat protein